MAKTPQKQLEYAKRHAEKLRRYALSLHKEQDADLIALLDNLPKGTLNSTIKQSLEEYFQKLC